VPACGEPAARRIHSSLERAELIAAAGTAAQQRADTDEAAGGLREKPCSDQGMSQLPGGPVPTEVCVEAAEQHLVRRGKRLIHVTQQRCRLPVWLRFRH
jgi:hypothetical protein